jgi:hypothetical protein
MIILLNTFAERAYLLPIDAAKEEKSNLWWVFCDWNMELCKTY